MTCCSRKIIVFSLSQFSSSRVSGMPGPELKKLRLAFQLFHSFRCVPQAVACRSFFGHLTGLISDLFNKKLTCLEGIHGPTFMDFVGKLQVGVYLELYVKACQANVISVLSSLLCFSFFVDWVLQDVSGVCLGRDRPLILKAVQLLFQFIFFG